MKNAHGFTMGVCLFIYFDFDFNMEWILMKEKQSRYEISKLHAWRSRENNHISTSSIEKQGEFEKRNVTHEKYASNRVMGMTEMMLMCADFLKFHAYPAYIPALIGRKKPSKKNS